MTDAMENHQGTTIIGGRTITNLNFADDNDGSAKDEHELDSLVKVNGERLDFSQSQVSGTRDQLSPTSVIQTWDANQDCIGDNIT